MPKKIKRKYKPSSGKKKLRSARRRIKVLERKIKRFERNKAAGKRVSKNNSGKSRYTWDTTGMEKQIKFLEKVR